MKFWGLIFLLVSLTASAQMPKVTARLRAQTATNPPAATSYVVDLSWIAPSGCATATPCTYTIYRELSGSSSYALIGTSASQTVTYTDSTVTSGLSYTYEAETVQNGVNSGPSAPTSAVVIPNPPAAPTGVTATATGSSK